MIFVLKKKKIILFCVALIFFAFVLGFFGELSAKETFFETEGKTIIIDAGHGAYR